MGERPTGRKLKRVSREVSGHARDKDRARRKRKLSGSATSAAAKKKKKPAAAVAEEDFLDWQDDGGGD